MPAHRAGRDAGARTRSVGSSLSPGSSSSSSGGSSQLDSSQLAKKWNLDPLLVHQLGFSDKELKKLARCAAAIHVLDVFYDRQGPVRPATFFRHQLSSQPNHAACCSASKPGQCSSSFSTVSCSPAGPQAARSASAASLTTCMCMQWRLGNCLWKIPFICCRALYTVSVKEFYWSIILTVVAVEQGLEVTGRPDSGSDTFSNRVVSTDLLLPCCTRTASKWLWQG